VCVCVCVCVRVCVRVATYSAQGFLAGSTVDARAAYKLPASSRWHRRRSAGLSSTCFNSCGLTTTAELDRDTTSLAPSPSSKAACSTTESRRLPTTHRSDATKLSRRAYLAPPARQTHVRGGDDGEREGGGGRCACVLACVRAAVNEGEELVCPIHHLRNGRKEKQHAAQDTHSQ
jgi:hypothetical protein